MGKETNTTFKVDMTVNGKQQAVELGMQMRYLENIMDTVDKTTRE